MAGMNHLFFRMCYLILAWAVALRPVFSGETIDNTAIFSTLFLFLIPLVIDYWGFTPFTIQGKVLQHIGGFLTTFAALFALIGLLNGIPVNEENGTILGLSSKYVWRIAGIWIILALADWIISITPREVSGQLEIRKMIRKTEAEFNKETMKKRTKHYSKERGVNS